MRGHITPAGMLMFLLVAASQTTGGDGHDHDKPSVEEGKPPVPVGEGEEKRDVAITITPPIGRAPLNRRVVVRVAAHEDNRVLVLQVESPQFFRGSHIPSRASSRPAASNASTRISVRAPIP